MAITVESLVAKIKQAMALLSSSSPPWPSMVSPSAYDTAWVAMVPHPDCPGRPMFPQCLQWVLRSQRWGGFWGETDHGGHPTLDCLTATLACVVALKTWGVGHPHSIQQGLDFLHSRTGELLATYSADGVGVPRWFAIVFPGMLEKAESIGLDIYRGDFFHVVEGVFNQRRTILDEKEHDEAPDPEGRRWYSALESYLEVLPAEYAGVDCAEVVTSHQGADGSLFQSPSATAFAFMSTGDKRCMAYLESMVAEASLGRVSEEVGVPAAYPVDKQLPKLFMVDMLERLGIAEHFTEEIADTMRDAYSHWIRQQEPRSNGRPGRDNNMPMQLYKDALAFRLLRMHGYRVSPSRLCWFLHDKAVKLHIEKDYLCYLSIMLNIYQATHLAFAGEDDLEVVKSFSKSLLQKGAMVSRNSKDSVVIFLDFQRQIEREMGLPWLARMDYLEQRKVIEQANGHALWVAKASFYKYSYFDNTDMLQLAAENFTIRQLVYRNELEELKTWSKDMALSNIGFGREKTAYIYFSATVSTNLPLVTEARKVITKCAVLVTVADDFYDMEGKLEELQRLTQAVQRWDGRDLSGHSKVIFNALHGLVEELVLKYINPHGYDLTEMLRNIWGETFASWMKEAEWSRNRYAPPVEEYIKVGMISIAIQAMILPACHLLSLWLPSENPTKPHYDQITRHLMMITRLLNDLQSYQKEYAEGKLNSVMLLKDERSTPLGIEESVARVTCLVDATKKEFLELVLMDGHSAGGGVPREWRQVHLLCLKAFQMLFNGENTFDSPTALLHNINIAIYKPLTVNCWPCNEPIENNDKVDEASVTSRSVAALSRLVATRRQEAHTASC